MLLRTAKSCGSDAPMLASSLAEVSPPNRALDKAITREATVTIKPGRRGEREVSRKTIACGNAGCPGGPVVTMLVCFVLFRTRGCGCSGHPAFPAPSLVEGHAVATTRTHRAAGCADLYLKLPTSLSGAKATKQSSLLIRDADDGLLCLRSQ